MAVSQNSVAMKFPFLAALVLLTTKVNLLGKTTSPVFTYCRQELRYKIRTLLFYILRTVRFLLNSQFLLTTTELLGKCSGQPWFIKVALKLLHLVRSSSAIVTGSLNFQTWCNRDVPFKFIELNMQHRKLLPMVFQTFRSMD